MQVKWFVRYTMREIKGRFDFALEAVQSGNDALFDFYRGEGGGMFQALYAALCDIDPHIGGLVNKWYFRRLDALHEAARQARRARQGW